MAYTPNVLSNPAFEATTPPTLALTPENVISNSPSLYSSDEELTVRLTPVGRRTLFSPEAQVEVEDGPPEVGNELFRSNAMLRPINPIIRQLNGHPSLAEQNAMRDRIDAKRQAWKNIKWTTVQWTINNYTDFCVRVLEDIFPKLVAEGDVLFVCFGKEVGPECGTPHLQGYTRFPAKKRWLQRRVFFDLLKVDVHCCWPSVHPANQGDVGMKAYCGKTRPQDERPNAYYVEWGNVNVKRKRGSRTDIHDAHQWITENAAKKSRMEIYAEFPKLFWKYNKAMDKLIEEVRLKCNDNRSEGIHIYWCWGITGSGKSDWVCKQTQGKRVFRKRTGKWWDGIDGEDIVILDDLRKNWMPFGDLLTIMDKYKYRGERKGGFSRVMANTFYITTPWHPASKDGYGHLSDSVQQLLHRIYKRGNGRIIEFKRDQNFLTGEEIYSQRDWSFEESSALARRTMEEYQQNNGGSGAVARNFVMHDNNNNRMMM